MKKYHHIALFILLSFLLIATLPLHAQKILSGPYLIKPGNTRMIIRWELADKGDYKIEYGKNKSKINKSTLSLRGTKQRGFLYEVILTDLKPGTIYFYRLMTQPAENRWESFKTMGNHQNKLTFVAMGDSRSNPDIFKKILNETTLEHPDFIISMGDIVENGGNYRQWHEFYFGPAKDVLTSTPLVSTLGDHEGEGDHGELFRYFLRENEPVDKQWFSFDYGNAHFISLDYRHPDDQEMIDWFVNDISSSHKKWNIVYMHRGVYNFGGHRSRWGRDIWPELFIKYKVDLVFAGHSHIYERFFPVSEKNISNAVTYVTTGGAGAELYDAVLNRHILAVSESVNHFITVQIDGNKLNYKAYRMDGSLLDSLEIVKTKKGYNKSFTKRIISQDLLNTLSGFNSEISQSLSDIPLYSAPVKYFLDLKSDLPEKIPFTVQLEPHSSESYVMVPYSDTLQNNEPKRKVLRITRKKPLTISVWGEITPKLRLMMIFQTEATQDTLIGGAAEYWPDSDD